MSQQKEGHNATAELEEELQSRKYGNTCNDNTPNETNRKVLLELESKDSSALISNTSK